MYGSWPDFSQVPQNEVLTVNASSPCGPHRGSERIYEESELCHLCHDARTPLWYSTCVLCSLSSDIHGGHDLMDMEGFCTTYI